MPDRSQPIARTERLVHEYENILTAALQHVTFAADLLGTLEQPDAAGELESFLAEVQTRLDGLRKEPTP